MTTARNRHTSGMTRQPSARHARNGNRSRNGNALGALLERHFRESASPCHSYSELERRTGISREALSRYVTTRADRRRSPNIDTLVTIADAMNISLEALCSAARATAAGESDVVEDRDTERIHVMQPLLERVPDDVFQATVVILRAVRGE